MELVTNTERTCVAYPEILIDNNVLILDIVVGDPEHVHVPERINNLTEHQSRGFFRETLGLCGIETFEKIAGWTAFEVWPHANRGRKGLSRFRIFFGMGSFLQHSVAFEVS